MKAEVKSCRLRGKAWCMRLFWPLLAWSALVGAAPVTDDYFGMHIHKIGKGTAWPGVRFGSWRLWDARVQWMHLEPARNAWQFERLDHYVEAAGQHGVSVLLPLGLTPPWASARPDEFSLYGSGRAAEPASMENWRRYVHTVATRYKGRIRSYEIWNEPHDKRYFSGSTAKLVELTCEAYKVVKAVDPEALVVGPAYGGEQNVGKFEAFLAAGGKACMDVASYHLYVALSPPEAIVPLLTRLRAAMKKQGIGDMPLWNTESGWSIDNADGSTVNWVPDYWLRVSGEDSAAFVARALLLGSAYGASRFYWYAWDSPALGLIEPGSGALKPGAVAYGVVGDWIRGNPPPACNDDQGLWLCRLVETPDAREWVVWSTGAPRGFSIPAGWKLSTLVDARGMRRVPDSHGVRAESLPKRLTLVRSGQDAGH